MQFKARSRPAGSGTQAEAGPLRLTTAPAMSPKRARRERPTGENEYEFARLR